MKAYEYAKRCYSLGELDYSLKGEKARLGKIISLVGQNNRVLDIGCYNGTLGSMLLNNFNEVFGIEANEEVSEIAKKKGLKVKIQNIESGIDFEANFFDVVVAAEIIEHILDTDSFICEIKRILKPNGFLVLSTPNMASLGRRFFLLFGKNPYFEASLGYPTQAHAGHIRFFLKGLLIDYLKHHGFKIIEFTSDVINFTASGKIASRILAGLFPTFGRSLIIKAQRII